MKRHWWIALALASGCSTVQAQVDVDTVNNMYVLGDVVIHGRAEGLDLEGFMRHVQEDTTFLHAFLNLRYFPHRMAGRLEVRNKGEKEVATQYRQGRLERDSTRASLAADTVHESGKLRNRKGEMRYLTAELYEGLFWPEGAWHADNTIATYARSGQGAGRVARYKAELKKFMFNPGQEIAGLPLIGDKMALFDPAMVPHYDFSIDQGFRNGHACWLFTATAKDSVDGKAARDNATVIKDMSTWFDQATLQVIAREYRIAHNTLPLDFDISIRVDNVVVGDELVPTFIRYDGDWNMSFRKREIVQFRLNMDDWRTSLPASK